MQCFTLTVNMIEPIYTRALTQGGIAHRSKSRYMLLGWNTGSGCGKPHQACKLCWTLLRTDEAWLAWPKTVHSVFSLLSSHTWSAHLSRQFTVITSSKPLDASDAYSAPFASLASSKHSKHACSLLFGPPTKLWVGSHYPGCPSLQPPPPHTLLLTHFVRPSRTQPSLSADSRNIMLFN